MEYLVAMRHLPYYYAYINRRGGTILCSCGSDLQSVAVADRDHF